MNRIRGLILTLAVQLYGVDVIAAIDQQYVPATTNSIANVGASGGVDHAQTFTVGLTGLFTGFDIWATRDEATTLPLLFDIRRTASGVPTEPDSGSDILAAGSIDATQFSITDVNPGSPPSILPHVELNEQSFSVVGGEVLAIALRSNAPSPSQFTFAYSWHGNSDGQYANGVAYFRTSGLWRLSQVPLSTSADRVFRTYVDAIPEPSTFFLLAIGAISLLGYRRSK